MTISSLVAARTHGCAVEGVELPCTLHGNLLLCHGSFAVPTTDPQGKTTQARTAYKRAIALARQRPERRFLERRLAELPD
jgi:hypothetical protein